MWNLFIYRLYSKIEEFGLDEFAKSALSKNIKFEGKLNSRYDLNKFSDGDLLTLCHDIGLFDQNVKKNLNNLALQRNICAHVTQPKIGKLKNLAYISEVISTMEILDKVKFDVIVEPIFQKIKKMNEGELHTFIKSLDFKRLKGIYGKALEEASLISNYDEEVNNKFLYILLKDSIIDREDDSERLQLFDLLYEAFISGGFSAGFESILQGLKNHVNLVCIKKYVLEKGYLYQFINLFASSITYNLAGHYSAIILAFNNHLTEKQIELIAEVSITNDQIYDSRRARTNLSIIFGKHKEKIKPENLREINKKFNLAM